MNSSQDSSSARSSGFAEELAGLLGEIEQDCRGIENARFLAARPIRVDDRRHLAVRVDRPERGRVLLALARVDRDDLVGEAGFFKEERDLGGVRSRVEIETDHNGSFGQCRRGQGVASARLGTTRTQRDQDGRPALTIMAVEVDGREQRGRTPLWGRQAAASAPSG